MGCCCSENRSGSFEAISISTRTLSALDLEFFVLESRERASNVRPLGIVKPPTGTRSAARFADVKQHVKRTDPVALTTYTAAVHAVSALLEAVGIERPPMLANMVISSPCGLSERRYLAGAEFELALPISVLAPGQSLNIPAAAYAKGLQIAYPRIAAELTEIQRMADYTVAALAHLDTSIARRRARSKAATNKPRGAAGRQYHTQTPCPEPNLCTTLRYRWQNA
jgi:WS/DGAT C-terminal domain